ncbi:MAG: hypothetical protein LUD73_04545 [Lachnospiraceae bacterium]|nr:hypothetical protein [Lachnospiraceae bacterium]
MKEFTIEGTKVIIHDDYCRGQTEEQRQAILQRVSNIVYAALEKQEREKMEKREREGTAAAS